MASVIVYLCPKRFLETFRRSWYSYIVEQPFKWYVHNAAADGFVLMGIGIGLLFARFFYA